MKGNVKNNCHFQISVSSCKSLDSALLIQELGASRPEKHDMVLKNLNTFIPKVRALRAYGSAGINLCYLAMGSVDAYFEFGFHIWDYAAPLLIGEDNMPSKNMIFLILTFKYLRLEDSPWIQMVEKWTTWPGECWQLQARI